MSSLLTRLALKSSAAAIVLWSPAVLAQTAQSIPTVEKSADEARADAAASSETIVITGSRIPRAGFDTIQPAMVLGSEQLAQRAYTNLGDSLNELPAFGVAANSSVGRQSALTAGQTFVDFFGLGSQRTLTLVNGRRFVSSNSTSVLGGVSSGDQVDFNTIPVALVDRIETVAVGGAPIYGADAIAGTVNVIMKRKFDGFEITGQTGISEKGDAPEYRLSAVAGTNFADGRGNIAVSGEWNRSDGILTSARFLTSARGPFYAGPFGRTSPFTNVLYYDQRYQIFSEGGVPLAKDSFPQSAGIKDAQGRTLGFDSSGQLVPYDFGKPTGSFILSQGGSGFPLQNYDNLSGDTERYLGTAIGSFQIADNVRVFGEAWYANSKGTRLRAQPNYNTAAFGAAGSPSGNYIFSINNPYLSAQDRAALVAGLPAGQTNFFLTRANTDISTGLASTRVELYRFVGGLDGTLPLSGGSIAWEVSLNHGQSTSVSHQPVIVQQNLANALDAVRDASGNIICRPGYTNAAIATANSTCAPLSIFGSGKASPEALAYVTTVARQVQKNTQTVFNANASGSLLELLGGPLGFALGYEHRYERAAFDPGVFFLGTKNAAGTRVGYGRDGFQDPVKGSFHTDEVFGELRIPIISPRMDSFIHELEFEGAARYVRHSFAGSDLTWTAGGRLSPVSDLTFRGNFTRSIRAPSITETFNPTTPARDQGSDPCDARFIGGGPSPSTRLANCRAAGIPAGFVSEFSQHTILVSVSGNPDLENEKADSWTAGMIARPSFIPNLTLAVDYVNIRLRNAIVSLKGQALLNACYDAVDYPNGFCDRFQRDAAGQITTIQEGFYNAASLKFSAVTAELAYRLDLADLGFGGNPGHLNLSTNYIYVDKLQSRVGTGDIDIKRGKFGNPKHSFTTNILYDNDRGFTFLLQGRFDGKTVLDPNQPKVYEYPNVKSVLLINGTIGKRINDHLELKLIVDNVFNTHAPFQVTAVPNGANAFYPELLGRYYRANVRLTF